MRDILVTLIVLVGCIYTLKRPYIGILLWSWLSYMNPHRLCFGFAYNAPFAQITAIVLLGSMLLSGEPKKFPFNPITFFWIIFVLFMGITTFFAYFPDIAALHYNRVIKIQLVVFLTLMLINDIDKLNKLIWIIVLSIGYYSVKGGLFTLLSGGAFRVWGPAGSYIEENNSLAVAVLMVIPLMIYLYQINDKKWIKRGLLAAIIFSLFNVLGSQSRGALIAIIAVGAFYWIKSQSKMVSGIVMAILAMSLLAFMPDSWYQRMDTINNYEQDSSAMGRINAWIYAYNAANDNLLGMGFESWSKETFALYAPNPKNVHAAHSIYFSVLGDHGWIGLFLYLLIYFMTWRKLTNIIKKTSKNEELKQIHNLAKMLQVAFIAYFTGGIFLSLSYFDLPWHLISIVIIISPLAVANRSLTTERIVERVNLKRWDTP
ncbi:putative O-glycosylation ligase, exosortase A system-associated [Candidatus Methylobacter favarea]|nr:putative O-glycosylation ligase, exosortase A system-associated [Candidatus Methylobacter favarea]